MVIFFEMQNYRVFNDASLENVGSLGFVSIESIGVVDLLIVDVQLIVGKIEYRVLFTSLTRRTGAYSSVYFSAAAFFFLVFF